MDPDRQTRSKLPSMGKWATVKSGSVWDGSYVFLRPAFRMDCEFLKVIVFYDFAHLNDSRLTTSEAVPNFVRKWP